MEDIVGRTSEAFGGEVSAAQLMASAAQSRFANALQIANYKTGLVNEIESQKQQEFSKLFNVLQLTGGEVEVGGKAYHIPGYEEQLKIKERITGPKGKTATQAAADARKTIQTLAISGATIDNVMSTGLTMGLDAEDVLNLYNASTPYGPDFTGPIKPGQGPGGGLTDVELERKYGVKRGELSKKSESGTDAIVAAILTAQSVGKK